MHQWDNPSVSKPNVDIEALSKTERLALIEELWESLSSAKSLPITPAQKAELASRSQALESGDLETLSADDVLEAIKSRRAQG